MFPVSRSLRRTRQAPSGSMTRAPALKSNRSPSGPSCVGRSAGALCARFLAVSALALAEEVAPLLAAETSEEMTAGASASGIGRKSWNAFNGLPHLRGGDET